MRQECLPRLCCISESKRHSSKKGNQRRFKSILKQDREIKIPSFPFANLRDYRQSSLSVVRKHLVKIIGFGKNSFISGTSDERYLCFRQHASERAERRDCDNRVADPIRAPHYNPLD